MTRARARGLGGPLLYLALIGCDGGASRPDAGAGDAATDAGPTCTVLLEPTGTFWRWPEPLLMVDDPSTPTGVRLRFDAERFAAIAAGAAGYRPIFTEDLADLDGFGVNAEVFFQFGRAFDLARLPQAEASARPEAGLGLAIVEPGPARLVPVLVRLTDRDRTPMLAPMTPLPPRALAVAFVTRALTQAAGGCLEPSDAMRAELAAPDGRLGRALDALRTLGVIVSTDDLVAVSAFVTQSTVDASVAVAADVASRRFELDEPARCTNEGTWRRCEGMLEVGDYRDPDGVVRVTGTAAVPVTRYRLPVTVYLPLSDRARPPYRTLVFGHGLGSDRHQGQRLAQFAAPRGYATVAIDAVAHGEHPTNPAPDSGRIETVLRFFTIGDLERRALEGLRLRDHFRQATYDKLQLTRWLQSHPDVDGDGTADLDGADLAYLGVSLGGIMGVELVALTDAYRAAVLVVPGGRVSGLIADSELFGALVVALRPPRVTEGDVRRFFPVLQTVLDRGDAASYGPHVLGARLPGAGRAPDVLVGVVLDDDTVPNVSNYALARAMGLSIVPPVLRPEPGMPTGPPPPVRGNVDAGDGHRVTAGLLQFDVVREPDGRVEQATHSNVGDSEVGVDAWLAFLEAHWSNGLAEIVDPYARTGLPHGRGAGERCVADAECRTGRCGADRRCAP
ncbi:MAG: hypothetical protein NZ898_01225 [Myxococcota bacterium]|nr:hypothetical protein [Myxococcota bacterium]MDW8360784.1 hypothetical protein [Myxococcales bacterium]